MKYKKHQQSLDLLTDSFVYLIQNYTDEYWQQSLSLYEAEQVSLIILRSVLTRKKRLFDGIDLAHAYEEACNKKKE